jgi:hypothetical protein
MSGGWAVTNIPEVLEAEIFALPGASSVQTVSEKMIGFL